ncbi:MAG: ATP-dependent DNA helicase RecG [Candidatus Marinimicrobia bacterium]|nr:ATP-dependent DNA helicase RecG [Candidatus Neomarinimicrobiota bacterium]|tara:strand:- start:438 stop:2531 length:2094 start_codon:yes stop_codon:yes gene_type:complete
MSVEWSLGPDTQVQFVKGVGPQRAKALKGVNVATALDLLYYFPRRHLDRTLITLIKNLEKGETTTVVAKVEAGGMRSSRKRKYYQLMVSDGSGVLKCTWFNGAQYIKKIFSVGDEVAFHAKVDFFNGYQMVHPEYDILNDDEREPLNTGAVIPLYPSSEILKKVGLDSRGFRRIIKACLEEFDLSQTEYFPRELIEHYKLSALDAALRHIHFAPDTNMLATAVRRLKFDEHFFLQLLMALRQSLTAAGGGQKMAETGPYVEKIFDLLSFELTEAQKRILAEIRSDMASDRVMNRLLQGDVGSGKTIVAILAAAVAVGNGVQVAVMAPTEILAHQHHALFNSHFSHVQIPTALLIGKQTSSDRVKILEGILNGHVGVVVGTHAVIQEEVQFKNLGLVVIDEQQRFGVLQRGKLLGKGRNPDILSMTATPIPRTLAISYHGDMDLSLLDEMPKHSLPVKTRIVNADTVERVHIFMDEQIDKGRQCMIVYPLIEESEKSDLEAATKGFDQLSKRFPACSVELLHGRMKREEKDDIMNRFAANEVQILVSTTVIEVGIDIPNATVMLIENAERFGLTQLHQLRGRVGRGSKRGLCVLVQRKITENSRKRLAIIERTNDGFEISDEDLKLRGPGEFYGTRQHGYPKWKIADIVNDGHIISNARNAAFSVVKADPRLRSPVHEKIRQRFMLDYQHLLEMVNIG